MDSKRLADELVVRFSEFKSGDWIGWIDHYVEGKKTDPELYLGDVDLDRKFIWVRNKFNDEGINTAELAKAVVAVIMTLAESRRHLSYLFQLIQVAGLLKPEEHAAELELLFKKGTLENISYERIPLQAALLNALINFVNIGDFTDYFEFHLKHGNDFQTNMLALKYYYSKKPLASYFSFVWKLIQKAEHSKNYEQTALGIVNSFNEMTYYRKNYNDLYDWLISKKEDLPGLTPKVYHVMLDGFSQWLNDRNETVKENYTAQILKGHIHALRQPTEVGLGTFIEEVFGEEETFEPERYSQVIKVVAEYCGKPDVDPYSAFSRVIKRMKSKLSAGEKKKLYNRYNLMCTSASQYAGLDSRLTAKEHDEFRDFMCQPNIHR